MQEFNELYHINILQNDVADAPLPDWLRLADCRQAQGFHRTMPEYSQTPLHSLPGLAGLGGVGGVLIKDEAHRFGLKAFKALGSSYAISQLICQRLGLSPQTGFGQLLEHRADYQHLEFITATDGNHGRGVAWFARQLGCQAHVYMPAGTEPERVAAIRALGAEVEVSDCSYDETVALAAAKAESQGWLLVQDTSWPGYEAVPRLIIQGYSTIAAELAEQCAGLRLTPSHVFLQAGVGSMAGGMLAFLQQLYPAARFIILEPKNVACCYKAAKLRDDQAAVSGQQQTIMAGLNCGTPCSVVMPLLRQRAHFFMACPDFVAAAGIRLADSPKPGDPQFVSGESGAIGLGTISLLLSRPELAPARQAMAIGADSVLLAINTEGAMAPSVWESIVHQGAHPLPEK